MLRSVQVGTVASPIAILNEFAAEAAAEGLKAGTDPAVVLTVLARVMAVAQVGKGRICRRGSTDKLLPCSHCLAHALTYAHLKRLSLRAHFVTTVKPWGSHGHWGATYSTIVSFAEH